MLPKIIEGKFTEYQPIMERDSMIYQYLNDQRDDLICLPNLSPYWSKLKNTYVLNFGERVKVSSIKNFQIPAPGSTVDAEHVDNIALEFGRISKNEFCLNVKYPFSILTAFGIALTAFDS